MKRIIVLSLILLVALLALTALVGCGDDATTTTEAADEGVTPLDPPVTVKVAYDNAPGTAGIILADKMGFFEAVGINIEYVEFASGAQMYQSLAANQVDVGRGIITASLFNGAAQDVRVWVVADSGTNVEGKGSYFTVVVRKDLEDEVKDFADLEGRKIGIVSVGSINEYFLRKALEAGGLTIDDVEPTIIAEFPDLNTGLANGAIDAAVQIEPLISSGEDQDILTYFKDAEDYAPGEQVAVLLYSDSFAKNTRVANLFMYAHLQGVRAYNDAIVQGDKDRDAVLAILTADTFIDDADMWTRMRPTGLNVDGSVLEQAVSGQQDYYASIGQVDETVTMDKVVDMSFAAWAVGQLGPYSAPE